MAVLSTCIRTCSRHNVALVPTSRRVNIIVCRSSSSSPSSSSTNSYKVVVVGGGSGGCSAAHRFTKHFGKGNVAVIEPEERHYYQPMFTLVGSGIKRLEQTYSSMGDVLPSGAQWLKNSVVEFSPQTNSLTINNGQMIKYEYLIVAVGLKIDFEKIRGLPGAFETRGVCSNYTPQTVGKTLENIQSMKSGQAIFTFPSTPIKCPGAPQKIMYLADAHWRKRGVRSDITVLYNTALPVIFGVPKYASALMEVVRSRDMSVNFRHDLVEIRPDRREAVFVTLGEDGKPTGDTVAYNYDMLHVAPPCSPPDVIKSSPLADSALGYVDVNKETLQHVRYPNVFAIGDCTNLATSKTAAACANQSQVVKENLLSLIAGKPLSKKYNGYTSCPLTTGFNKCIMAEFGYDGRILETFPVDQGKERYSMYYMKRDFMPQLYWHGLIKGIWNGPSAFRKLFHPLAKT